MADKHQPFPVGRVTHSSGTPYHYHNHHITLSPEVSNASHDLPPQLLHPQHILGIVCLLQQAAFAWGPLHSLGSCCPLQSLKGLWALSHTGDPHTKPLLQPTITISPASILPSDFSNQNLGKRLFATTITDSPRTAPFFSLVAAGGGSLSLCKQVLRQGVGF